MANIIPGANVLGFGFNSLKNYGIESVTSQLFAHQTDKAESWTFPPTQTQYDVPDNISISDDTASNGKSYVFSSQQEFQSHFASDLHAGISAEFGTFHASFDSAYSSDITRTSSYYYGVFEANFNGWDLTLKDDAPGRLSPAFLQDPDVQAMMSQRAFRPDNAYLFFRVFNKFGTHFVNQVSVGGKLYYYSAVDTSYSSDAKKVSANISLEYKTLFMDTSVQSSMDWETLGQQWTNSRKVNIDARGGDTGPLSALDPAYGNNFHEVFSHWQSAVMQNPAVIEFKLRPLSILFSGDLADAIGQALKAYCNAGLSAMAEFQNAFDQSGTGHVVILTTQAMLNGQLIKPQLPEPPAPYSNGWSDRPVGLQLVVLDGTNLNILLKRMYYLEAMSTDASTQLYEKVFSDITTVAVPGCIFALTAMGIPFWGFPNGSLYDWLRNSGAALQKWEAAFNSGAPDPGVFQMVSYVCVGQQGNAGGSAYEAYIDELSTGDRRGTNLPGLARVFAWLQPPTGEGEGYTVNAGGGALAMGAGGD